MLDGFGVQRCLQKNSEHNIDGHERRKYKQRFVGADGFVGCGSALKARLYAGRHLQPILYSFDCGHSLA
jgi:hypothetical protein